MRFEWILTCQRFDTLKIAVAGHVVHFHQPEMVLRVIGVFVPGCSRRQEAEHMAPSAPECVRPQISLSRNGLSKSLTSHLQKGKQSRKHGHTQPDNRAPCTCACPLPHVLSRVTFMRDARAPAAGHSTHFNPHYGLFCFCVIWVLY